MSTTPSLAIYGQMQRAFTYLNAALFDNKLPDVVLTLRRHPNTRGYYITEKYRSKADEFADELDEIALNPDLLLTCSDTDSLSTMAHEMCHQWECTHGKGARRGHHSKGWGNKMKQIGLYPSSTGAPGGKETGSRVSHYILAGGRFEAAAAALLAEGFTFAWGSVAQPPKEGGDPR